jgi:putative copper export protein
MYKTAIAIHVLAATIWTGGHIVLFFAILLPALKTRDHTRISLFEVQFEKIGIPALLLLVTTGLFMAYKQLPDMGAWFSFTTAISRTVSLKIALLLLTVALAAHARFKIIPKLNEASLNSLAIHITLVTLTAMLFALTGVLHRFGGII